MATAAIHSMSSTCSSTTTTSRLMDGKRQSPSASASQCVTLPPSSLPSPPPFHHNNNNRTTTTAAAASKAYCGKLVRNVVAMATAGEAEVVEVADLPPLIKPIQDAWEKVEDKYAVSSLVVAGGVFLWGSTGMISAIDRLPLIPGVLELVGIGYTGWFAYKNLVFKPDRQALIEKIKCTYKDIIGSSSS